MDSVFDYIHRGNDRRTREKESCSFEPTASALGMAHGYSAVVPQSVHSRPPSIYDPQVPLSMNDATAAAWSSEQEKESVGKDAEMGRIQSIVSEQVRLSIGSQSSISGLSTVQKPENSHQARPSRPWSEAPSRKRAEEVVHAM